MLRRIVIAPDKFKGSLSARDVAVAMARGFARVFPQAALDAVPVADGGEGTAETIVHSLGGRMVARTVRGPDGKPVQASFGLLDGAHVVEVGTHEELVARRGQYAELYGIQAAAYQ